MTMEKQGVVNEQNTRPETPDEKDLTQHLTKRAEGKIKPDSIDDLPTETKDEVLRNGWRDG
jgi:hypothetical protein